MDRSFSSERISKYSINPAMKIDQEKTETDSCSESNHQPANPFKKTLPKLKQALMKHQTIYLTAISCTYSGDKIIRFISSLLKIIKNFNLINNLKSIDKVASQIGQLRRLLRVDRLFLVLKDYLGYIKKQRLTKFDCVMIIFKAMILVGDYQDSQAYLIQLGVIKSQRLPNLRQNVADFYFFQCIGWLIYYTYEYFKSESQQARRKCLLSIVRYIIDTIISQNDYSKRITTLNIKLLTLLGLIASILNLCLIWK